MYSDTQLGFRKEEDISKLFSVDGSFGGGGVGGGGGGAGGGVLKSADEYRCLLLNVICNGV